MSRRHPSASFSAESSDELSSEDHLDDEMEENLEVDGLEEDLEDIDGEQIDELQEEDEQAFLDDSEAEESSITSSSKGQSKRTKEAYDDEWESDEEDQEVVSNRPLTKRQRAKLNNDNAEEFLELPMETGKKKHLTAEEQTLRRSEVARRRKNQSIQRAEKDKQDTINRLLKKQASKSRKIIRDDTAEEKETPASRRAALIKDPHRLRYVNKAEGSYLGIPSVFTVEQVFGIDHSRPTPKPITLCEVSGCQNAKKYVARKSGKAVCSLEHYRIVEAS